MLFFWGVIAFFTFASPRLDKIFEWHEQAIFLRLSGKSNQKDRSKQNETSYKTGYEHSKSNIMTPSIPAGKKELLTLLDSTHSPNICRGNLQLPSGYQISPSMFNFTLRVFHILVIDMSYWWFGFEATIYKLSQTIIGDGIRMWLQIAPVTWQDHQIVSRQWYPNDWRELWSFQVIH